MEVQQSNKTIKGLSIESHQLNLLLKDHPYFQLGLMEKSRRYRDENHIDSLKLARKCAILFPDRALLYSYLHENNETEVEAIVSIEDNSPEISIENEEQHESADKGAPEQESPISSSDKDTAFLEKEYIKEAIDQSIRIEASNYSIESNDNSRGEIKVDLKEKDESRVLSFSEWIGGDKQQSTSFQSDIIEQFIQEKPQISKLSDKTFYSPIEKGKQSLSEESLLYSETLASIFVKQGNSELAIKAYRYLMSKNPQKSIYFADLIKKLEETK